MWTAPQRRLLLELNLTPKPDVRLSKKSKAIAPNSTKAKEFPKRSGNLETPLTNPQHRRMMGQPENPHGLGEPFERGIVDPIVGDDAGVHPSIKKYAPERQQGPSETPGRQTWTSFGNRYPR
jgi:hypothetical protein